MLSQTYRQAWEEWLSSACLGEKKAERVGWLRYMAVISIRSLCPLGKGFGGREQGHALAREWEPQCHVQRCHWLFCSSGVPVACPQGATSSQKWGRLQRFATTLEAQELPAIPPCLPTPPDQLPAFTMSCQLRLQQAHATAGMLLSFPGAGIRRDQWQSYPGFLLLGAGMHCSWGTAPSLPMCPFW